MEPVSYTHLDVYKRQGFGYDPIFYLPEYGCSTAELSLEKKNELSHRGKALHAMRQKLKVYLDMQK